MRKFLSFLLVFSIFISTGSPILATDYSNNEEYWRRICKGSVSEAVAKECDGFTEYLNNKADKLKEELAELDKQIDAIQGDLKKLEAVAADIQVQIDAVNSKIEVFETKILETENKIAALELEIQTKEIDIITRDEQIKERMLQTQTFNQTNGYIDFLMGASDFVDLIRRISVMNQITEYEQNQIELLNKDIQRLEVSKVEIEEERVNLISQKEVLDENKKELEQYQSKQLILIREFKQKEEDLMDAYMRSEASMDSIRDNMPSYSIKGNESVTTSSFGMVCTGTMSAGTWYYPASFGGGRHSGMDIAGPNGTPVTAPFNGIVAIAQNITNKGGLGVSPYTGNNVMLIGSVNGKTYAIHLLHLQYNSIKVKVGDVVTKGQVIANRGSTGNSSGPHVHIDLYNLRSEYSVESAYNYVKRTGTYTFGMPYKANGWECSNKKTGVCKEKPEDYIPL